MNALKEDCGCQIKPEGDAFANTRTRASVCARPLLAIEFEYRLEECEETEAFPFFLTEEQACVFRPMCIAKCRINSSGAPFTCVKFFRVCSKIPLKEPLI